jgi:hypothetical protein
MFFIISIAMLAAVTFGPTAIFNYGLPGVLLIPLICSACAVLAGCTQTVHYDPCEAEY